MIGRGLPRSALGLAAVTALVVGCTDTAQQAAPAPEAPSAETSVAEHAAASDDLLQRNLRAEEPGCSAAVGIEGDVAWAGSGGLADLSRHIPIETSTRFDIASVSKQFTATTVLLLEKDGRLALDDPVARWVPGLPAWSEETTISHLVHHRSGIPDYIDLLLDEGAALTDRTTQRDALDALASAEQLRFPAGQRFEYSNSNYVLLAEVVRAAAGEPLPEVARELVFEPLHLDMAFDPSGSSQDDTDPASARAYIRDPATGQWEPGGSGWEQIGDGAVQTTPSELVRWADYYRTGRIGRHRLDDPFIGASDAGLGDYGAGIVRRRDGSLWHGGQWAGYLSDFWVSEDRRTAVAVTCNGDRGPSSAVRYVSTALQQEWG